MSAHIMRLWLLSSGVLFSLALVAQYPSNPAKSRLGYQTTGDGLIFRGAGAPAYSPGTLFNAWTYLDTTNMILYGYKNFSWVRLPSANNGLTMSGAYAQLGGSLNQNTTVESGTYNLKLGKTSGTNYAYMNTYGSGEYAGMYSVYGAIETDFGIGGGAYNLTSNDADDTNQFSFDPTGFDFSYIGGSGVSRFRMDSTKFNMVGLDSYASHAAANAVENTNNLYMLNNSRHIYINSGTGSADITMPFDSITFTPSNVAPDTAELKYSSDYETFVFGADGTTIEVGQKEAWYVKNQTGSTINKGTVVRASGTLGSSGRILISPMVIDGTVSSKYLLGITASNIANGADGYVIDFGKLRKFNTSSWSAGSVLYAGTGGTLTATEPNPPNLRLPIAFVVHSHAVNGVLAIRIQTGNELHELHDVDTTGINTNEGLVYNSTLHKWQASAGKLITAVDTASMLANYVDGSGTATRIPILTGARTIGNSPALYNSSTKRWTWDSPSVLELPMGTDAQRPSPATTSDFWYNMTGNGLEWYNGTRWAKGLESTFNRGTAGSIPFFDANGQATQDNGNLFWNNSTKRLGIGTASPSVPLEVYTTTTTSIDLLKLQTALHPAANIKFNMNAYVGTISSGALRITAAAGSTGPPYIHQQNELIELGFTTSSANNKVNVISPSFNISGTFGFSFTSNTARVYNAFQQATYAGGYDRGLDLNVYDHRTNTALNKGETLLRLSPSREVWVGDQSVNNDYNFYVTQPSRGYSGVFVTSGSATITSFAFFQKDFNVGTSITINSSTFTVTGITSNSTATVTPTPGFTGEYSYTINNSVPIRLGVYKNGGVEINQATGQTRYELSVNGNKGIAVPRGTVAQRPTIVTSTTPIRYNTDSTALEYGESVGTWRQLATRTYARSLISALPTTNIYTADGTLTGNRTLTGSFWLNLNSNVGIKQATPLQELDVNGDLRVRDSTDLDVTPAHTAITGLLTRDATGWVGAASVGTGLAYSGGVLSSSGWNLSGNSISGSNFLGSTNNQDVVFKQNNIERFRLNQYGGLFTRTVTGASADTNEPLIKLSHSGTGEYMYAGITLNHAKTTTSGNQGGSFLNFSRRDSARALIQYDYIGPTGAGLKGGLMIRTEKDEDIVFQTNSTSNKMIILGNGNVGIGTIAPTQELDVNGELRVRDSTILDVAPAHTTITGLLTRDASGRVGAATLGGGLSYSGGVLSSSVSTGTVTSVGLFLPSIFSVSGSPVTTSGTLSASFTGGTNSLFLRGDGRWMKSLYFNSTDSLTLDASGGALIRTNGTDGNFNSKFEVFNYGYLSNALAISTSDDARYNFDRSRGTIATPTALLKNDRVGGVYFNAHNGSSYRKAGYIGAVVDSVLGANISTKLIFGVSQINSAETSSFWRFLVEEFRNISIRDYVVGGNTGIGIAAGLALETATIEARLHVKGTGTTTGKTMLLEDSGGADILTVTDNKTIQAHGYGTGTKEASDLSKTESVYNAIYATDGTLLEKRANTEQYNAITSTTSPQTLSSTIADNLINQGSTQATFTLNMPASPVDGQIVMITYNNAISTLTIDGNGNTIVGSAVTTAVAGSQRKFKFYTGIGWIKQY